MTPLTESFTDTQVPAHQLDAELADASSPGAWALHDASTFGPAFRLIPRPLRDNVLCLYDILRSLDDLVDEHRPEAANRVAAVEGWCRTGKVDSSEAEALQLLARHTSLPSGALLDFCLAMRHDIERRAIETEADLDRYCSRAGGAVGVMTAAILGTRHPSAAEAMQKLGMAAQRTNILRDIDEDLDNGHVYIARETIERFGSLEPGCREALVRDQIARADALYEQAIPGIALLAQGRRAVRVGAELYREILRQIEREGCGRWPGRVVVPRWRQQLIVARWRLSPRLR